MKRLSFLLSIVCLSFTINSFAQIKAGTIIVRRQQVEDSIVFDEPTPMAVKHADYMDTLAGSWELVTMKRQARMEPDYLINAFLVLNKDSTFTGSSGCSEISGKFSLKGSSVRFTNVITTATKQPCSFLEQESWYLKLLQNKVSTFSISDEGMLWLRDGSSNIIFEGNRKEREAADKK